MFALSTEFANAQLGDARRTARLARIADQFAAAPDASLPERAGNPSQAEGTYRFLNNSEVQPEAVLLPHQHCTVERAAALGEVLVLHDTTEFSFAGDARQGLGWLGGSSRKGFYAHMSLCVSTAGKPLGLLGLYAWARHGEVKGKRPQEQLQYDDQRESLRWPAAVQASGELLYGRATAVHVMDREGDCFEWFAEMVEHDLRFVVRVAHDRRMDPRRKAKQVPMLYKQLHEAPVLVERTVPLTRRVHAPKANKGDVLRHPPRAERTAHLEVRVFTGTIALGNGASHHLTGGLQLQFVEVSEPRPPEGEPAVLWRLATTEPVQTAAQALAVVDIYRRRWVIEEYFKALKTGCRYEHLQLETARALMVALPIYAAVAWRLLLLRWMERHEPQASAEQVLTEAQLGALTALRRREGKPLSLQPTAGELLLAIARLGGHMPQNGPPGWQVLGRGMHKLLMMELGWLAARQQGSMQDAINL